MPQKGMMAPGTGFPGPNIYLRALHAIRSKQPEEEAYALHHLVKISHERGDKYRFDQFPGLAEALIEKVIQGASLFYDVAWEICYAEEDMHLPSRLNGLNGTADLLERIQALETLDIQDDLQPERQASALNMVNEAALIVRNMVMLHENALHVSMIPAVKDMLVIILNLPHRASVLELQHYALEIAEQLTRFWHLDAESPLYKSLLAQVDSEDRGRIITILRALGRIAMNLEYPNKLPGVTRRILQLLCNWLLVDDDELRNACLDFLYLFTGFVDNVEKLVHEVDVEVLVGQLTRLLQHGSQTFEERKGTAKSIKSSSQAENAPKLSQAIVEQLSLLDEPERSSQWLRTCFEEDPTGEITQIQLWSAYNAAFADIMNNNTSLKALMPAKDFITNVSTTFGGAMAQVITNNGQPKYTIRGIRPRSIPVDPTTKKTYMRCCWQPPSLANGYTDSEKPTSKECGEFTSGAKAMWEHVVAAHLNVPRDESGKFLLEQKPDIDMANGDAVNSTKPSKYFCYWSGCKHFGSTGTESPFEAGQHIKTHLPETGIRQAIHAKHNRTASTATSVPSSPHTKQGSSQATGSSDSRNGTGSLPSATTQPSIPFRYFNTVVDETNEGSGVPLAAMLVLRNLARQLGKLPPPSSVYEVVDSHSPLHKRTHSESNPEHHRSTSAKKPRLSDATKEAQAETLRDEQDEADAAKAGWVPRVFGPVKDQLAFVLAHNLSLRNYMGTLFKAIKENGG